MQTLVEKYDLDRINFLIENKSQITEVILEELRSFGLAGKQIALDILELKEDDPIQDIHCIEIEKCKEDLFYFKDNYLLILNDDELQNKFLKAIDRFPKIQINSDRQTKKTYAGVIYALWQFNFEIKRRIGIASFNFNTSKYIISNITNLYNHLPEWMKVGGKLLKTSMTSSGNVNIIIDKIDGNSFRGQKLDCLIVDGIEYIKPQVFKELQDAIEPSNPSKIIFIGGNSEINYGFIEVNENTILEEPVKTEKPILKRSFKQIIKDLIESLYKKIKG